MTSNATCAISTTATSSNITMVANPLLTPSVSIAASATNVISGTNVTFTATPTNGGTSPIYQWKKNNVNVGTNASTYSDASLANNDVITCVLTSNETCVTSATATSSGITMTVLPAIADALNMDGTDDYVALPNSLATSLTASTNTAITIEYWFKGSNIQSAVRFGNATNYIVAGWGATGPKHAISTDGGTAAGIDVGATAIDGNWHHVAMTWQKNTPNGFKSYLDGVLVAQRNSANANLPAISTGAYLGALGGTSEFMSGNIDEVRIWNRPLEQCEIQNNRTCELAPAQIGGTSGLLAYYQFHQGLTNANNASVTTVTDASGNAYEGTLYGFGLTGLSSNWVAPGGVTSGAFCTPLATPSSVSIAITTGSQKIIIGTSVTFTATPVNAGASPTYQWTKNGINVGTNSATYTDAGLSHNDVIMCTIPNNNGVCPLTVSSNQITMNVSIIRYVKIVATGTGDGSSWANASADLQGMINAPSVNEVWVWVAAGTYKPTLDPLGASNPTDPRLKTFQLKNGVKVYGGFAGTEVLLADRTLTTIAANPTILSGDFNGDDLIAGSGSTLSLTGNAENAYHVLISVANDNSALIDGFIVKGGNANGNTLIFIGLNYLIQGHGGGIYNQASAPTIQNMTFIANSGGVGGGGVYNSNGSLPLISNCAFVLNYGGAQGGGVLNYANSNAIINSCVFYGNYAFFGGGLLNTSTASPAINNCTFYGNHGYLNGGGIYNESNSAPIIKNAVIWGNTSPGGTSGIVNNSATATVTYSNVQGTGVYTGTGNLMIDPLLYDPADADGADNIWRTADDGLRLACLSTSYDAGTNTGTPALDILDRPLFGTNKDMGAYESQSDLNPTAIPTISASSPTSVCTATNVTLTATGNGGTATQFAWFKNGVYTGTFTTLPTYTFASLLGTNQYSVVVIYNGCPSVRSSEISVTGNTPVAVITPSIPASVPYCVGSAPTLDATPPTGSGYTYSWICTACGTTTTGASYIPTNSGPHRVVVTDANGCQKMSNPATSIYLNPLPVANAGTDKFPCVDSSATLGVTSIVGNTYQWTPSTNLSNATISNPKVTPPTTGTITYTLTVTNASGCSKADQVDVSPVAPPAPPTLSSNASSVCQGQSITLTPGTTGSIYWYKNGAIFGSLVTSATFKTFSAVTTSPDIYTIRSVVGLCKSLPSNSQSVMVNAMPAVTLSSNPGAVVTTVSVCNPGNTSGTADLSVVVPSGAPAVLGYNWQVGGVNVVPAATNALYTAPISIAANNKVYRAQVTYAGNCTVNSPNMTVKMLPSTCTLSSVSIAITSGSQSTCTGSSVTFTATPLNATNTPVYQWKKNGINVGTNAATYTDAGLANGDVISCTMTDGSIVVSSNSVTMTVNAPVTPTLSIAITAGSQSILYGTSVTFTATSSNGGTSPSYQWKKNNVNVGTNSATYTDAALVNNDVITCEMTSNAPCPTPTTATSNSLSMTVIMPGAALNFDGVDDYISLGNSPSVQLTQGTLEAWIKTTNAGSSYRGIVAKLNAFGVYLFNNILIVYDWTNSSWHNSNMNLADGIWHHVAFSFNSGVANGSALYVDGASVFTFTYGVGAQSNDLFIGHANPSANERFTGNMDEVRIWNRALSQCEIQSRMNCELASGQSGLTAYYKFNQGFENSNNTAITSLTDASGNGLNVTLLGFGLTGTSSNWIAGGAVTTGTTCALIPTVTIAASATTITAGTSVTFTATPTNGGASPTYQWKKNNLNVGTNSATYTDATLLNNDVITCDIASTPPCSTIKSNSIKMTVMMPGAALNFDGVDDYVNLGTTIPNLTTFTLETWVNPGTGYGYFGDPAQPVEIISRFGAGGVGNAAYRLGIKSSGKAEFYVYNASTGASAVQSTLTIPVNTWTHIAATRTADNTMNIYINGVLDATISGTITPQVSNYPIYLGSPIAGPNKYKGNIDEVRIWSRALSQCEIQSRMNCELASGQSGLSAYYKFNQGFENSNNTAITSLTDASGNGVNGTLMGFGLTGVSSNWIAGGGVTTGTTCVLSPSITITATATTITPGTNVTFTATPTNGGTSPSYQWKKNNLNVGTNSVTYTDATLVNNDIITCEMTSATPCPTLTSNSLTIAGIMPGAALNFDGVDDYVNLGTTIPNLTTFTLEAWIKPGAGYGSFGDLAQPVEIISRFGAGGAGNAAYRLGIKLSGKAEFYVYNASTGTSSVQSTLTIPINTWTHIAATRTSDNTMNIYINGVLDATISGTITPQTSSYPIYLGRPISGVNRYNGGIDEVRIWSRALSQCEIQSRMNCELASGQSCLLGYYKFNQGLENSNNSAVTSLTDASGNGVDGTLVGFGLTGAISNWIAAGAVTTGTTCASNPSITIAASATTITTGTNVTFTATASNAGTTPVYQWKKNGANVGSNLNTYTDASLIQGDEIACIIKTGTCLNSPAKASNVLTMNVSAPSVVRYVKPTASGTGDGTSWANASADLQAMINVTGVEQVWVAGGTYKPTTTTNRSIPFTPKSNVGIYGGFAGTETTLCERNVAANVTTLSGDIGTIGVRTDNSYTIINAPAVTNAILDGFTIRDGQDDLSAGPVRIDNNGSMSFVNCTFRDNVGYLTNHLRGTNSTVYLIKCKFSNSVRIAATDVASTTSTFYILDCFFTNSTGGAFGNGGTATVNNSVFTGINASLNNGGIFSNNGVIDISNCTVTNNSAYLNAGGYTSAGSTFTVRNSIFWNNPSGHGLSLNGTYSITYSNIQGGVAGEGNVNVNPSFVSTTNIAGADGVLGTSDDGLIPQATSTCTENLLTIPYSAKDVTGFVVTSSAKMGAYSVSPCANPAIYTLSGGGNYCSGGNGVPIALSNSQTGTSYQLYICSDPIGSAVTGTGAALNFGSPTTAGTYTVIATNTAGGCSSTMLGTAYVQSCGGSRLVQSPKEEDIPQELLLAYPNPTEGNLVVSIQNSPASEGVLTLYNALGQVLISRTISLSNGACEEQFDLTELVSGVYTLSFQTANGKRIQKIVKE